VADDVLPNRKQAGSLIYIGLRAVERGPNLHALISSLEGGSDSIICAVLQISIIDFCNCWPYTC
jgi:hypothetical protein